MLLIDQNFLFDLKLKGDFCRYICEYDKALEREKASVSGNKAYQDAMNLAKNMNIMEKRINLVFEK